MFYIGIYVFETIKYYKTDFNSNICSEAACNGPGSNLDISWHIGVITVHISIAID